MIASRSCCRFVVCTSMMWISRSTTSQRCSIGLRSGDCGGHLSKVNSLSCSRNQSGTIWALCHGALSCWKYIRRWVHCSHKGMDMVCNNTAKILTLSSECCSRNRDSSDVFPIFYCPVLVSLCELYPPCAVLIWQERHPVWSSAAGVHLLQGSTCCAFRDAILHTLVVQCDWLISNLCYQAIEQVYLIKWLVSVHCCD